MKLTTLGGLELEGSGLKRPTPLLLLTYLALEGPKARDYLAELFWPGSGRGLKNLSMTLARLEEGAPGVAEGSGRRVGACVQTDYEEVREAFARDNWAHLLELYGGPFLEGVPLPGGTELEEWVYERREEGASRVRRALLALAERAARRGQSDAALRYAERAYNLAGAPALEPEEMRHLYSLLWVSGSPYAARLQDEAAALGLPLPQDTPLRKGARRIPTNLPARETELIGRERELQEAGARLAGGTYGLLTLVGPAGVGKTSLALAAAREALARGTFPDGVFFVPLAALRTPDLVLGSVARALDLPESSLRTPFESVCAALQGKRMLLVLDNFEHVAAASGEVAALLSACPALQILVTSRAALRLSAEREFPIPPLDLSSAVTLFVRCAEAVNPVFSVTSEDALAVEEICRRLDGLPLALELAAARAKLFAPQAMLARLERRLELLTGGARDHPARHQTLRSALAWSYDLLEDEEKAFFRRLAVFEGCTLEAAAHVTRALGGTLSALESVAALVDKSLLRPDAAPSGETRFVMLETVREYALTCLEAAGEGEEARRAHAEHLLEVAERAAAALTGPQQGSWLELVGAEHDNLRAALAWAHVRGEADLGLRLGAALWRFWIVRGHLREGRAWLEKLVTMPTAQAPSEARANVLNGLGTVIHELADFAAAQPHLEASLVIQRERGDRKGTATALNNLGWVEVNLGNFAAARAFSKEALALSRDLGEARGAALSLNNLGWAATFQGDFAAAQAFFEGSLALRRDLRDPRGVAFGLTNLAWTERYRGELQQAATHLDEALNLLRGLGDTQLTAWALCHQGATLLERGDDSRNTLDDHLRAAALLERSVALWREVGAQDGLAYALSVLAEILCIGGDFARAEELLNEGLTLWRAAGNPWWVAYGLFQEGVLALVGGDGKQALQPLYESLRMRLDLGDRYGVAESLGSIARLSVLQHAPLRSAWLLAAAEALHKETAAKLAFRNRAALEACGAKARVELGDATFKAAWAEGQRMTLEEIGRYALADLPRPAQPPGHVRQRRTL